MAQLRLKNAILKVIPLVVVGIFFIFGSAWASTIFVDDFEDYDLGSLDGQGDWTTPTAGCDVVSSPVYHGNQAVYNQYGHSCQAWRTGATATSGEMFFYAMAESDASHPCPPQSQQYYGWGIFEFLLQHSTDYLIAVINIRDIDGTCFAVANIHIDPNADIIGAFPLDQWNKLSIAWDFITQKVRYSVNGNYTAWLSPKSSFDSADLLVINNGYYAKDHWDYFTGAEISGIEPILTPEHPVECEINQVDYNNIEIKGNIKIPNLNPNTFDDIVINFGQAGASSSVFYYDIDLPNLTGGQDYTYDTTTTLPYADWYNVLYVILGYDEWGNRVYYYSWCMTGNTYITELAGILPETIPFIGGYELPTPEECPEASSTIERLTCEIKNFLQGIFLPSQGKIGELKQNIGLLRQKFPMNYLSVASTFFSNVRAGINASSTISLKVFGQSGNLDFSIWDKTANIASTSQKFSDIFGGFFGLIFIGGFLTWAILFTKRIFK